MKIMDHSIEAYRRNTNLILLFSIPFLVAFLIPVFITMPTFPAVGSIYLRTGSIPMMTMSESGLMLIVYLISLYLVSFAIVNINIVIKAQRASVNIKKEVIKGISTTTFGIFLLYILYSVALLVAQLITYSIAYRDLIVSILNFIIGIPFFYAPAAMVIDGVSIERSLKVSVRQVIRKPWFFAFWLATGVVLLSAVTGISLAVGPNTYGSLLAIFLNSVLVLPYLIVMQTQMYLAKYPILS